MKAEKKEFHPSESAVGMHMDEMTSKGQGAPESLRSKSGTPGKHRETKMDRMTEEAMHLDQ